MLPKQFNSFQEKTLKTSFSQTPPVAVEPDHPDSLEKDDKNPYGTLVEPEREILQSEEVADEMSEDHAIQMQTNAFTY